MAMAIPEWIKPAAWGAIGGAVAIAIVGFNTGWVVTGSSAQEMAERQKDQAVLSALTPICVAQFNKLAQADRTTQLAALEKESSWERGDYVEEQGWATMPGSKQPHDEVAEACSSELMKLAGK